VRGVRYELRRRRYDILLLGGCKNDFLLLGGVKSVRYELRRRKYENFLIFYY